MDGINDIHDDERTPLLEQQPVKRTQTPLDKAQLGIILLLQVCEPICGQSIYPYINELVSKLDIVGGDEAKIGYYAGLIESLFFLTEAITVYQWSRISDGIGRKPVLMIGMFGTMLSMLSFGLSRTFSSLVISRCLCGLLNGNIGVIKSTMGELTDSTNRADAFAWIPVVWAFGATMGPLMGGLFARPADRFPSLFAAKIWTEYPYFLSTLVPASVVLVIFVITGLFFRETVTWETPSDCKAHSLTSSSSTSTVAEYASSQCTKDRLQDHVPLRGLMTFPIIISIANDVTLAFLNISVDALIPLFFHMPIEMGGLDLDPAFIGYVMGCYGAGTGAFQVLFFAKLVRRFGIRHVFIMSMSSFIPLFLLFPMTSAIAKKWGIFWGVWALVVLILFLLFTMDTAYGCIFMYITESTPNRRSLGATNGLAQTTVSIARAIGPALSTSLFSFSVQRNILGGYGVYAVMILITLLSLLLAVQLPKRMWGSTDDADVEGEQSR